MSLLVVLVAWTSASFSKSSRDGNAFDAPKSHIETDVADVNILSSKGSEDIGGHKKSDADAFGVVRHTAAKVVGHQQTSRRSLPIGWYTRYEAGCRNCSEAIVVVDHGKETNMTWLFRQHVLRRFRIFLYSDLAVASHPDLRRSEPQVVIENLADEASKYLHFIVSMYDTLPERIFFLHSHQDEGKGMDKMYFFRPEMPVLPREGHPIVFLNRFAPCDHVDIDALHKVAQNRVEFANWSEEIEGAQLLQSLTSKHGGIVEWMRRFWAVYLGKELGAFPESFYAPAGGEFVVAREAIQRRSHKFYQNLLTYSLGRSAETRVRLMHAYRHYSLTGGIFENLWGIMFDDCPAQRKARNTTGYYLCQEGDDHCDRFYDAEVIQWEAAPVEGQAGVESPTLSHSHDRKKHTRNNATMAHRKLEHISDLVQKLICYVRAPLFHGFAHGAIFAAIMLVLCAGIRRSRISWYIKNGDAK